MFSDEGTYGSYYSTISAPVGYAGTSAAPSPVQTGVLFAPSNSSSDLADFTENGSSTFNYSDFYVYVMYGNYLGGGDDTGLVLTLGTTTIIQPISDANSDASMAKFSLFHITGMTSGETLQIGATAGAADNGLIGGVSFVQAVPEPSTWVMLLVGGTLALSIHRFRRIV